MQNHVFIIFLYDVINAIAMFLVLMPEEDIWLKEPLIAYFMSNSTLMQILEAAVLLIFFSEINHFGQTK